MNLLLRIDLEPLPYSSILHADLCLRWIIHVLIHRCRTEPVLQAMVFRPSLARVLPPVGDLEMHGLVLFVIGARAGDRSKYVEGNLVIRLRILLLTDYDSRFSHPEPFPCRFILRPHAEALLAQVQAAKAGQGVNVMQPGKLVEILDFLALVIAKHFCQDNCLNALYSFHVSTSSNSVHLKPAQRQSP